MEDQEDGSTLFTDYDNLYQLALPEGWIVLPLSSEDLADILESVAQENPDFKDAANVLKGLDPDVIRVMALNKNSKYNVNGFTTNLIVMAIEDKVMTSMPMDFVTGALEESIKEQGGQVVSTDNHVTTNANGVEIGNFDFLQAAPTTLGARVQVLVKERYAMEGMVEDALEWLRLAVRIGNEDYPLLARTPKLVGLRADPRFTELLEELRRRWEERRRAEEAA